MKISYMNALVSAHSGLRWLLLLTIIISIVVSYVNRSSSVLEKKQKLIYLSAFIFSHIQLLIGLILYFFISPKVVFSNATMADKIARFFTVEHSLGMLIAIALITIGYIKCKKQNNHNRVFWFYLIALVIIFASIPWPFREALGVSNWA